MRINKQLLHCIRFACFCKEFDIEPKELAELLTLVNRRITTATNEMSGEVDESIDRTARLNVEKKVQSMNNIKITGWSSIMPDITDARGIGIRLPID